VQDPDDAAVPSMVRSALCHVDVDHVVPIDRMADLLSNLGERLAAPTPEIPLEIRLKSTVAAQAQRHLVGD
jgi:two-component system chemotaxis response regulator CheB